MRLRFWEPRYDPYPDLMELQQRIARECMQSNNPALQRGWPAFSHYISHMVMYATIGKDRKKLTPAYVERTEAKIREWMAQAEAMR